MTEPFRIDDDRYQSFRLIPWWDQARLANARVLVVGAGALGNETLKNLALLGVGTVYVSDFDRVERSNLARSTLFRESDTGLSKALAVAKRIREMDSNIRVIPLDGNMIDCVGLGLIRDCDMVLGCVDNREARLWINRCCWRAQRPWIDAAIHELSGVVQAFAAGQAPCYECGMKENDYRLMQARYSCPGGLLESVPSGNVPTTPTIASIIAGWQTQWCIKFLHGMQLPWGEAMVVHGLSDQVYRSKLPIRLDCLSHENWSGSIQSSKCSIDSTARELLQEVASCHPGSQWRLKLERPVWTGLRCLPCDRVENFSEPRLASASSRLDSTFWRCDQCQGMRTGELMHEIDSESKWVDASLQSLGVPDRDWVQVVSSHGVHTITLANRGTPYR